MEQQRTVVPIFIAAIVAILCCAGFVATTAGASKQETHGLTMVSAAIIERAGATATPTDRN